MIWPEKKRYGKCSARPEGRPSLAGRCAADVSGRQCYWPVKADGLCGVHYGVVRRGGSVKIPEDDSGL